MSLPRFHGVKSLKYLPGIDKSLPQLKAVTGEILIPVSIEDAVRYWVHEGKHGNLLAQALVEALAIESIERRADTVCKVNL